MTRLLLIAPAALLLGGCNAGLSACERATRAGLPPGSDYRQVSVVEDPGETPAMTYYVIDYIVTARDGSRRREQVHCAYARDFGEAVPHRTASAPLP